ncbi:preprotein translocase subunit YajC [Antrihabitans spumae]|jgi:preprotein translocase subunit YajC|uniref:Preprotein translocase subunit YajC n=1 Tax=Antrihabitans spumae TaxID=3373370 RepID=A0ABW7KJD7_9NOCA
MENLLFPLLLVALIVPMYLATRRQKKEMAKTAAMQSELSVGDRVLMTSGIQGIIVEVDETSIDLEIAEDVITTWTRSAVREVLSDDAYDESDAVAEVETDAEETPATDTTPRLNKD